MSVIRKEYSYIRWPIVYREEYNVRFYGLEKFHPFDASKWKHIFQHLKDHLPITEDSIYIPNEISDDELLEVHSKEYLQSLMWSYNVAAIAEIPILTVVPNCLLQKWYLKPMRFQTAGSILAGELAMQRGWSINLGGGFHHCSKTKGAGFCPYADITLLIHNLFQHPMYKVKKAMIVDLDAHQGNGYEIDFIDDNRVFILDIYNGSIYPFDIKAKNAINFCLELTPFCEDGDYLQAVERGLEKSLSSFRPDIIVYNAGTDVLEGDPLGKLAISPQGIIDRDKIVFMKARERRIPLVMLTSGGYLKETAEIIANSIINLQHMTWFDELQSRIASRTIIQ